MQHCSFVTTSCPKRKVGTEKLKSKDGMQSKRRALLDFGCLVMLILTNTHKSYSDRKSCWSCWTSSVSSVSLSILGSCPGGWGGVLYNGSTLTDLSMLSPIASRIN